MSILHFSGQFLFQIPEYNNETYRQKFEYDPELSKDQIFKICGCDPSHYFELNFQNVTVKCITYRDGTLALNDPLLNKNIQLTGIMPSISPSLSCYILYAGRIKIGEDILTGIVSKSVSSQFRTNIRPIGQSDELLEAMGAHFDTHMNISDKKMSISSQYLNEISNFNKLEVHLHLNNYYFYSTTVGIRDNDEKALSGDVYGYICPLFQTVDSEGLRVRYRRILAHPNIESNEEIAKAFLYKIDEMDTSDIEGLRPYINIETEIDGTYDIIKPYNLLCIRYLDFVPLLNKRHDTLDVDNYRVSFEDDRKNKIVVGEFKGDYEEMKSNGGLVVFKIPMEVNENNNMKLIVEVIRKNSIFPLMMESEYDIMLETDRAVIVYSGEEYEIIARVFKKNRVFKNCAVFFETQNSLLKEDAAVRFDPETRGQIETDDKGIVKCKIKAVPISPDTYDEPIKNEDFRFWDIPFGFPLDMDHANYLYLRIENPLRATKAKVTKKINNDPLETKDVEVPVEEVQIAARVLHEIKPEKIKQVSFKKHILPLFSYYIRYYPWLHTYEENGVFQRIFNIEDYDQVVTNIDNIITRLELNDDNPSKMPRSRDFPKGGKEAIKKWKETGMLK
jgi:hypothetical protein